MGGQEPGTRLAAQQALLSPGGRWVRELLRTHVLPLLQVCPSQSVHVDEPSWSITLILYYKEHPFESVCCVKMYLQENLSERYFLYMT